MRTKQGLAILSLFLAGAAEPVRAEQADYGQVELSGLSRDVSWPYNPPGTNNAMVCNVNGPDGFLSVREGPGADHPTVRKLERLTIVEVDTRERQGRWVRVVDAHRSFSKNGERQIYERLRTSGWAHDGYLCSYIDYPAPGAFGQPEAAGTTSPDDSEGTVTLAQADGKPARCEWNNGNDGPTQRYACRFTPFDGNGSFSVIGDDGYELMLTVERPGSGTLVEFIKGRRVSEFGRVLRSKDDPACWEAESGTARLCAR